MRTMILGDGEDVPRGLLFDPAGMLEFQIDVQLPGNVVETNGVTDESTNKVGRGFVCPLVGERRSGVA